MRLWLVGLFLGLLAGLSYCDEGFSSSSTTDSATSTRDAGGGSSSSSTSGGSGGQTTSPGESGTTGPPESTFSTASGPTVTTESPGPVTTGPSTPSPEPQPTNDQTDGSTEAPKPTTAFDVATVKWEIPVDPQDPTDLLRAVARLNFSVSALRTNLNDLYNNLNINNSNNYLTKLNDLAGTISALQANTTNLAANINASRDSYQASKSLAQPFLDTLSCFRSSPCIVPPTTTAWSPAPTSCPGDQLTATNVAQSFAYSSGLDFNCKQTISSANGDPIELNVTATFTDGVTLVIFDAINNTPHKTFTKEDSGKPWYEKTGLSAVRFEYSAEDEEQTITLSVTYNSYDICQGVCKNDGVCSVQAGKPHCSCINCYKGDTCEDQVQPADVCTGNQVTRYCKTEAGTCNTYYDGSDCTWVCDCKSGYHRENNNQTCVANSPSLEGRQYRWLLW